MSTFANNFLKALREDTEGNAFTGILHKDRDASGKAVKKKDKLPGGKEITVKSGKPVAEKKENVKGKKLPTNAFTPGKTTMHKENVMEAPKAQPQAPAADAPEQNDDAAAWEKSLDKDTNPKDFETPDNPQHTIDVSGVQAAHEWIGKLEEMAHFINGTGAESLNSQINQLEIKNSVPFRGIVRREEKRLIKLAENLRGLAEVFKSVVITSEKKIKDVTSPR
jgi:hypothetical protein